MIYQNITIEKPGLIIAFDTGVEFGSITRDDYEIEQVKIENVLIERANPKRHKDRVISYNRLSSRNQDKISNKVYREIQDGTFFPD